jgi:hypothetical protein
VFGIAGLSRLYGAGAGSYQLQARGDYAGGLLRGNDGMDFEIDNVAPVLDPLIDQFAISCLHYLEAALEFLVDPARNILQAVWSHPAILTKSSIDRHRVTVSKVLNDHE